MTTIHDFTVRNIQGEPVPLSRFLSQRALGFNPARASALSR